jgi:hypothetical protein
LIKRTSTTSRITQTISTNSEIEYFQVINSKNQRNNIFQIFFCCLLTDEKNDFYKTENRRKSSTIFKDLKNRRKIRKQRSKNLEDDKSLGLNFLNGIIINDSDEQKLLEGSNFVQCRQNYSIEPILELMPDKPDEKNCRELNAFAMRRSQSSFIDNLENETFHTHLFKQQEILKNESSLNKDKNSNFKDDLRKSNKFNYETIIYYS